jgi:hypothetical protein
MNIWHTSTRKLFAWLAVFAMLLQLSNAMHVPASVQTFARLQSEICTASGLQLVSFSSDGKLLTSTKAKAGHRNHCSCCCNGGPIISASANFGSLQLANSRIALIAEPISNPKPTFISAAHPRGPPMIAV